MTGNQLTRITAWEVRVLRGVVEVSVDDREHYHFTDELRSHGWVTSGRLAAHLLSESFHVRKSLRKLAELGSLDRTYRDDIEYFRITPSGMQKIAQPKIIEYQSSVDPHRVLDGDQVHEVIKILHEIQDVAEETEDNFDRAQISGFARSLEILIQLPVVPKTGILALIRDPAFANVVALGAFLTAIYAAVK